MHLFGKVRRSDWRPVHSIGEDDLDFKYRDEESLSEKDSSSEDELYIQRQEIIHGLERLAMEEEGSSDAGSEESYLHASDESAYEADYESYQTLAGTGRGQKCDTASMFAGCCVSMVSPSCLWTPP